MSRFSAARAQAPSEPGEQDKLLLRRRAAFHDAKRHSQHVMFLRRGLPVLGGISIILLLFWLWLDPLRYLRELPVQVGALKISGTKLTMEAPRLTGFSKEGLPYNITADAAAQDLAQTNVIEMTGIVGKFSNSQRGETVLRANSGVYDSKEEKMRLFGDVRIDNEQSGYAALVKDVVGEPKKGHLVSEKPAALTFNEGDLRSDRIEIFDHGKSITFEGNVVMNLKSH